MSGHTEVDATPHSRSKIDTTLLGAILQVLLKHTALDFRGYRSQMLSRRIYRRISLGHLDDPASYLSYLEANSEESQLLAKDVLISQTRFFRQPNGAFNVLETAVIPELLGPRDETAPLRIWVPGCATGEEAYSIAILLVEEISKINSKRPVTIFASDIDRSALAIARAGRYSRDALAAVSPKRLDRFFRRSGGDSYQVAPVLQNLVTFSAHDLISDVPYSTLDFISCRNVLVCLEPELQEHVISRLHFALRDHGVLMAGPADRLLRQTDGFEILLPGGYLYRRAGLLHMHMPLPGSFLRASIKPIFRATEPGTANQSHRDHNVIRHLLAREYGPASLLVDREGTIVDFHGVLTRFIGQPVDEVGGSIFAIVDRSLRNRLSLAMRGVFVEQRTKTVRIARAGHEYASGIRLTARYIDEGLYSKPLILICFEEELSQGPISGGKGPEQSLVRQLEFQLEAVRKELVGSVQAYHRSLDGRKHQTEEALSINEELQSANEELERSKWEMNSLNEELLSANQQLQEKVDQLQVAGDDLTNLIDSTELATICLDEHVHIQWFTPAMAAIFHLLPVDAGRSIADIAQTVEDVSLIDDARQVFQTLVPMQKELPRTGDQTWMRRIRPYRSGDSQIRGTLITYTNITGVRVAEERLRRLTTVLLDSSDGVTVLSFSGTISAWNRGAELMYGYSEAEALSMNISELVPPEFRAEELLFRERARDGFSVPPRSGTRICKSGALREVHITTTTLIDDKGSPVSLATTERDLTHGKAVAHIEHLATHDQLTGLPNRFLFEQLAAQAVAYALRTETKMGVLFIDINEFKKINDTLGHPVGDLVLELVARRLKMCVRGQDTVVRHGGDEFVVLLSGIHTPLAAASAAEHILSSIGRPYTIQKQELRSTVSIGISIYPDDALSLEALVRNADTAMYRAKARGGGGFCQFTADMATGGYDRRSIGYGLPSALERREFLLQYQPQVEVSSGRIIGAEALLRWQHPEFGMIRPEHFIALAEQTGLIVTLGEWVMLTACTQAKTWQDMGLPPVQVGVNLSSVQIAQTDLPAMVTKVLADSGLEAKYLELEITESGVMHNIQPGILRLQQLHEMGVHLALDDFGTGYSSLSYLRQLPIDRLKLDVSFVHALTAEEGGNILVRGILGIAKSLKLVTIAEGVETLEQFLLLREEGCDEIQGYYFSEPVSPLEFQKMLQAGRTLQPEAL